MKTSGFDKFIKKLEADIDSKTDDVLKKVGTYVYKDVKMNTPVKTGRLRRSWKMSRDGNKIIIHNNTKYAPHVEFGHRTRKSTTNNGISIVPGRFMLRNAVKRGKILLNSEMGEIKIFGGKK